MGVGISKKLRVVSEKPRESEDPTDKAEKWQDCLTFEDLPEKGRAAFIKYAEEHRGTNDRRRLEFWFRCPDEGQLGKFLEEYLVDEPLPEVGALSRKNIVPKTVVEHASGIDDAIKVMKDDMRTELNECFKEFIKHLKERSKPMSHA